MVTTTTAAPQTTTTAPDICGSSLDQGKYLVIQKKQIHNRNILFLFCLLLLKVLNHSKEIFQFLSVISVDLVEQKSQACFTRSLGFRQLWLDYNCV